MNDKDRDAGAISRWWLNPALARMAFGVSTRAGSGSPSVSLASAIEQALQHGGSMELDLDDPAQCEFGDYELLDLIGRGGMGVVYRARQRSLNREVAIKLLSAGAWAPEELVEGLRREAQHAALLQHPNIVVVHEMGEHAGLIYYAMQLVRGRSLSQQIDHDGIMSPREAAALLRTVAEAVDYAHRLGVLHLDLKPGNILLDEHGAPLVADFGLARRLEQALDNERISGTPSYMAPEQARANGPPLTPATDVWALGAVLYEMLTGHPPFEGDDATATLRLLLEGEVRKPSHFTTTPADLEAICLKCLRKDPAQRYADARALADDLGRFLEGRAISVRPLNALQLTWRWARREPRLATMAAVAICALLVGVTATLLQWRRAEHNAAAASERLWESRREAALRLQQDGKGFDALPRLLLNVEEQERAGKNGLAQLERQRIGMLLGQGAVLIDQMLVADANPLAVDVSPDGQHLAIAMNDLSVRWYDTATLTERGRVSLPDRPSSGGEQRVPILLRFAGNDRLRVTMEWYANHASPSDGDSWLIDLGRKAVIEPPAGFADFADAIFSADGRHALLRDQQRRVQLWEVSPWKPISAFAPARLDFHPWLIGPEARQAAMLTVAMRDLLLHDLPDLSRWHSLRLPHDAGTSAWAMSHDGRTLALGDFEGRTFLLDLATRRLRPLPTARGREVTWLAFSEDDAWLAAANLDGTVYALDVATGDALASGTMQHDFVVRRVDLNHQQRLLVVAGEGEIALWRLPWQAGPRGTRAERIATSPMRQGTQLRYSSGWSLARGLLATAGLDGQVRLWRLPRPVEREARATYQVSEKIWFDGQRLVDVEWNRVRIIGIDDRPLTPWLELPQPPGFAELVDRGETLLITLGPQLRIYDAATLRLRHPPIALPNSPQRLLSSADAACIVLGFGVRGPDGFAERLHVYNGRRGKRLPGDTLVTGPLRTLALSPDAKRLLAVGPPEASTTAFSTDGLQRIGEYPHDPFQPVVDGDFRRTGPDVLLVLRAPDPRLGKDALVIWDPARDRVSASHSIGAVRPLGVIDTSGGPFVAGIEQALLDPGGPHPWVLERPSSEESTLVTATSADGRIVAHASHRRVQLYDSRSGAALGPPLQGGIGAMEIILQAAFAPDGRHLAIRTARGRWLVWALPPETRPARPMLNELAQYSVSSEDQRTLRVPAAAERAALRARDPGPWSPPQLRPAPPVAAWIPSDHRPIPARVPGTSPLLLDLTELYTAAPESVRNHFFTVSGLLRPFPPGVQRIGGIDFDIRGLAEFGRLLGGVDADPDWQLAGDRQNRSTWCQPVPAVAIAAVHPLMLSASRTPIEEERTLAVLRLRYADGGSAEVPLRVGRELPGYAGNDQEVPYVFTGRPAAYALGQVDRVLVAPRLPNPYPDRVIRCLQLQPFGNNLPFAVYAITAEPVIAAGVPVMKE